MKLSEKIHEAETVKSLAFRRADAVRALRDLDSTESVTVGGEYSTTEIPKQDGSAFVAARALLVEHINWCNGELMEMGIVIDLSHEETGLGDDGGEEEEESEAEEADADEVPA
jgi:hypothetical protein